MVKVREKCFKEGCNECDLFPLYMRGYDNKFTRAIKENEVRGKTIIKYGYFCPIHKDIVWRNK